MKPVRVVRSARKELRDARLYYQQVRPALGVEFIREFELAVKRLQASPGALMLRSKNTRQFALDRFPYVIIYADEPQEIVVLAVMHVRRRPGYWEDRV